MSTFKIWGGKLLKGECFFFFIGLGNSTSVVFLPESPNGFIILIPAAHFWGAITLCNVCCTGSALSRPSLSTYSGSGGASSKTSFVPVHHIQVCLSSFFSQTDCCFLSDCAWYYHFHAGMCTFHRDNLALFPETLICPSSMLSCPSFILCVCRNHMYVSPTHLNFTNRGGSARNIAIRTTLMYSEDESSALRVSRCRSRTVISSLRLHGVLMLFLFLAKSLFSAGYHGFGQQHLANKMLRVRWSEEHGEVFRP